MLKKFWYNEGQSDDNPLVRALYLKRSRRVAFQAISEFIDSGIGTFHTPNKNGEGEGQYNKT